MLKKLSKYGNSTTLVIDKTILELLNMSESTVVKLRTDGKSLIITPVESNGDKISYENFEALHIAKESQLKKMTAQSTDSSLEASKKQALQEGFSKIFAKPQHQQAMNKFSTEILPSKDFQEAIASIAEKFDPVTQSHEYIKEFEMLKLKFCPELKDMQNEMEELTKKYNYI